MSSALSCTKCAFAHQSRSLIPSLLSLPLSSFSLYAEFSLSRCQARCLTPILLSHTDHALTYRSRSLMLILHSLILTALFDIMRFLISSSIQEHSLIKSALSHTTLSYSLIPSALSHTTTSYQVHSLIQLCHTLSYQVYSLIPLPHTKCTLSYHYLIPSALSHTTLSNTLIPSALSHTTLSHQALSLIPLSLTLSYQVHALIQSALTRIPILRDSACPLSGKISTPRHKTHSVAHLSVCLCVSLCFFVF